MKPFGELFRHALVVLLIAVTMPDVTGSSKKSGPTKKPAVQNTYSSSPFILCKESRPLNPVETFKAHGIATTFFRHCGKNIIMEHAQLFKIPASAIYPLTKLCCLGIYYMYGYNSVKDGTLQIAPNADVNEIMDVGNRFIAALKKGGKVLRLPSGNQTTFQVPWSLLEVFLPLAGKCLYGTTQGSSPTNGDYLLHLVKHLRYLLL